MKILMLSWEYPPRIIGGISRVVHELSKRLQNEGHEVTVVTYREENSPYFELEASGVKVHRVDNYLINPRNFIEWVMQLNFNMVSKVCDLIHKGEEFDVIHAHDWLTAYSAKTLKHSFNLPLVSTIHATEAGRNSGIHNETQKYINDAEWLLTYESEQVIVNSNYMKNEIQRLFGLPFEKISVIPNGIDLDKFDNFERDYDFRRQYAQDNEKIILAIGRLVFEKGFQHLIAAMPKILSRYNDAKLVIVGKGGMENELKAQVKSLGIENKVYFTGYMTGGNVQKIYKAADVAVFPSTYEPFGIVALEGMLAERPVVVSDIGGLDEIVKHGVTGMKSYAGNANSIADSILTLLFDHKLSEAMVKNAKKEVIDNFNWKLIAEKTYSGYQEAILQTEEESALRKEAQSKAKEEIDKENEMEKDSNLQNVQRDIKNLINFNNGKKQFA